MATIKAKPKAAPATTSEKQSFEDPALKMAVSIPSPPPLLRKINHILQDPNASMEDIGHLVQTDAGLTASLFRTLGKPVYGLRRPPETVTQAISLVGLNTVAELVRGIAIEGAIFGESPFYAWFWERANDIARFAATIAWKQRTVCNLFPEHAHLAAMFMDCGVPILIQHFKDYEKAFMTPKGYVWPNVLAEDAKFNTDHAVVGYLAARHWKLPDYVCQAIRWHHDPINVNEQAATLVAILQTAKHLYNIHSLMDDSDWANHEIKAPEEIGVSRDGLREFEDEIFEQAGVV